MASTLPDLTGRILLAHPNLRDPSFRRSIVYLAKYSVASGALGFVINRATPRTLDEADFDGIPTKLGHLPVHFGGPVSPDNLILTFFQWEIAQQRWIIHHTIDSTDEEQILEPETMMAFVGYAGWSPGQLEQEIAENSWIIHQLGQNPKDLFKADATTWKRLVSQVHPHLKLLAEMPDEPQLN